VINFRYHVVSLTAVFLALAIGMVVATAALNGPAADALNDQVSQLRRSNEQMREQVKQLESGAGTQEDFVKQVSPTVVAGRLTGRRVLMVVTASAASNAGKYVDPVKDLLDRSGAKVTAKVTLADQFFDPASNEALQDLVTTTLPNVTGLPNNLIGVETSSALLAAVLLDRTPAQDRDGRLKVLAGYSQGRFLTVSPDPAQVVSAEAVVFVTGGPYTDKDAPAKNKNVLTAVTQFDAAAPEVLASPLATGDGNALAEVRGDPKLTKTISTVDDVGVPQGWLVTVLALVEQLKGSTGHYGIGGNATALAPKLTG